jgi:hypothetical protein
MAYVHLKVKVASKNEHETLPARRLLEGLDFHSSIITMRLSLENIEISS